MHPRRAEIASRGPDLCDLHLRAAAYATPLRSQRQGVPQLFFGDGHVFGPTTRSSAILAGTATLTVAGSQICSRRVASVDAFFRPLSPGSSKMIAPVMALRILIASMPTSASGIFPLADASTSAYDVFAP